MSSQVSKYQGEYQQALEGFSRAGALDPTWQEPPTNVQKLLQYLSKVQELIQNKVGKKFKSGLAVGKRNTVECKTTVHTVQWNAGV